MIGVRRSIAVLLSMGLSLLAAGSVRAATEVDLALVLAVDVSQSMEPDEQELQREGYVEAFRSPEVQRAIRQGLLGRIAVTYVEWSGMEEQQIIVPWTVVEQPEDALDFAERLARSPINRVGYTSISGAIDFSIGLLRESGVDPARRVVDISGDGPNNQGRSVTEARDEAIGAGITINGLPILLKDPSGAWDIENLDLYYRDCVIGGPGAFMIPVHGRHQFVEAIRTKIVREVSGRAPPGTLVQPAQNPSAGHCSTGEPRPSRPSGG
ncbi:DUF1194 domain-containing protein [Microvirga calopogonii]|uniref:DUF1194 domain-containing protein n=1 Tax=Microvirga calopogonii TaxID=2078013 RepID=UPI000E0D10D0|nr:DUF1194 domain-containing protein [Microvirga calopogonii]